MNSKTGAALLLAVAAIDVPVGGAAANPCAGAPPPSVTVNTPRPAAVYDRSKGVDDLAAMMGGTHASGTGFITLGVTAVEYAASITTNVQIRRQGAGPWCAYPISVTVDHGFSSAPRIYIARELREGTCKYAATMEHELRHLRIHETGLWRARAAIESAIAALVRRRMPITGGSSDEVTRGVNAAVSEAVESAAKAVAAEVQRENDAMDTHEAYMAFSKMCQN